MGHVKFACECLVPTDSTNLVTIKLAAAGYPPLLWGGDPRFGRLFEHSILRANGQEASKGGLIRYGVQFFTDVASEIGANGVKQAEAHN